MAGRSQLVHARLAHLQFGCCCQAQALGLLPDVPLRHLQCSSSWGSCCRLAQPLPQLLMGYCPCAVQQLLHLRHGAHWGLGQLQRQALARQRPGQHQSCRPGHQRV